MFKQQSYFIQINNLSYKVADKLLFHGINLSIHKNDRMGFIGHNGSGKSCMLKILSGKIEDFRGSVMSKGKVAYVPQIQTKVL